MSDEIEKGSKEKGIKKEQLNWLLRAITLGDRFSIQDFYDRVKKGFVEFLIVFFGGIGLFWSRESRRRFWRQGVQCRQSHWLER